MRDILLLAKKELQTYFYSPVAYLVLIIFLLLCGWLFFSSFFLLGEASMRGFFGLLPLLLVVFSPAVTMRLLADEQKSGSIELLTTLPISDWAIIGGKYLAAVMLLVCGLAFTLPYVLSIASVGVLDLGPVLSGYLGALLLLMSTVAIGLLASAWCNNQISALLLALAGGLGLYLLGPFAFFLPESLGGLCSYLSFGSHFANFTKGLIDSRDVIYFLTLTGLALYLAVYSLGQRRVR